MTDYRALCAELVEKLDDLNCNYNIPGQSALVARAQVALSAPTRVEGVGELALELELMADRAADDFWLGDAHFLSRAAAVIQNQEAEIERLKAQQPPAPAPVSEPPKPKDLDAEGTCWVWNRTAYTWGLFRLDLTAHSHWLPAHALPLPAGEGE